MSIYRKGTAGMATNGVITGQGTTWQDKLSLIRVGATIAFMTSPPSFATISAIVSDTEMRAIESNGAVVPDGTNYIILLHDSITVDGLAQDVAETLRYYQSQDSVISEAVETFKDLDINDFHQKVQQVNDNTVKTKQYRDESAQFAAECLSYWNGAKAARDEAVSAAGTAKTDADRATLMKGEAERHAGDAYSSKVSAANDAATATTKAGEAKTSRDESVYYAGMSSDKAAEATNAASTATTKAGEAANSASTATTKAGESSSSAAASKADADRAKGYADSINTGNMLAKANNLSDVPNKATARTNLQLGSSNDVTFNMVDVSDRVRARGVEASSYMATKTIMAVDQAVGSARRISVEVANSTTGDPGAGAYMHYLQGTWFSGSWQIGGVRDASTGVDKVKININRGTDGSASYFEFHTGADIVGHRASTGETFIFTKSPTSDRDLKHDIKYTAGKESYDRVMQWLPTMFKYNGSEIQRYGFIAQDLMKIDSQYVKIVPGKQIIEDVEEIDVNGDTVVNQVMVDVLDDTLALDSNVMLVDLGAAFVYQSKQIDSLRSEVDELKELVNKLVSK